MGSQNAGVIGFSRQETMKLTGCSSSRLAYLEKVGLIVPTRIGVGRKPIVLFSWEQLLEIIAIKNLRQDVSLQTVRRVVEFLNQSGYDDKLKNKQLVVVNDDVLWLNPDFSDLGDHVSGLTVASKKKGRVGQIVLLVIPPLSDIVDEIWETAKQSKVVDFESFKSRAKAHPA